MEYAITVSALFLRSLIQRGSATIWLGYDKAIKQATKNSVFLFCCCCFFLFFFEMTKRSEWNIEYETMKPTQATPNKDDSIRSKHNLQRSSKGSESISRVLAIQLMFIAVQPGVVSIDEIELPSTSTLREPDGFLRLECGRGSLTVRIPTHQQVVKEKNGNRIF